MHTSYHRRAVKFLGHVVQAETLGLGLGRYSRKAAFASVQPWITLIQAVIAPPRPTAVATNHCQWLRPNLAMA